MRNLSPTIPTNLLWPTRILILSMVLLALGLLIHPLGDPDVYIHLRDGRYWVEKGLQVDKEPFAYTVPEKHIERVEILFRIGIYLAHQIGGYSLLTLLKALAMTAALFFLGLLIYRRWPHLGIVGCLLALAVLAPMNRIMPERPYVVTYFLLPLILLLLDKYYRTDAKKEVKSGKKLWFIPLLVIPWANLHPGFIVLFGFLGAQLLDDMVSYWRTQDQFYQRRIFRLSLITGTSFLAGAINPIGFSIYTFVIKTTGSHDFMKFLTEWAPPRFAQEPLFFILLGSVWSAQILALRRIRLVDLIPMAAFSYMAVKSYRNMPLFFIATLPPLAEHLQFLWRKYFPHLKLTFRIRRLGLFLGSGISLTILIWASITGYAFRLGEIRNFYPAQGLAWLMDHPINGRLLTHDIWGGYTGWITQGQIQVFIDGRFPLFGEKLYSDYRKIIWGDPQSCLALLDRYKIQGILVSPKNDIRLYRQLWKSRQWALIYWDDVCLLYVRKTDTHRSLIKAFQYKAIDPKKNPYFNPAKPELALQEARRAAEIAPDSFLPWFFIGELLLHQHRTAEAERALAKVLKRAPRHVGALYNLGVIAHQEKRFKKAEHFFRAAIKSQNQGKIYARTCYMLALTLKQSPRRRQEALHWAKRALNTLPAWKAAEILVRELEVKP